MLIRHAMASMLTALAVLVGPAVLTHAETPAPGRSPKAVAPKPGTYTEAASPEVAASPTTGETTPESGSDSGPGQPSEERRKILENKSGRSEVGRQRSSGSGARR